MEDYVDYKTRDVGVGEATLHILLLEYFMRE